MTYDDSPFRRHAAAEHEPSGFQQSGFQPAGHQRPAHQAAGQAGHQVGGHQAAGHQATGYQPAVYQQSAYRGSRQAVEPEQRDPGYGPGEAYAGGAAGGGGIGGAGHGGVAGAGSQAGGYQASGYGEDGSAGEGAGAVSENELEHVFDDPEAGGRDRMAIHWIWEALLLVAVGALAFLLWQADPGALRGGSLALLLIYAAGFGLLGLGAGVTLRAGVPNLAIGPVAVAAGVYYAQEGADGVAVPAVTSLVAAVALGALVAVLVVGFHVPGWAASLGAAAAVLVWLQLQPMQIEIAGGFDPTGQAAFLFALVAAMAILGGLLGTIRGVRRAVGSFRPVADPARRRGGVAALFASGAILLSMAFAAAAGVVLVAGIGEPIGPGHPVEGSSGATWLTWTVIGFGVALAGGTSAFGRRGGVFGTVLTVLAVALFHQFQTAQELEVALLATGLVAFLLGLLVTRLVETFGKARSVVERSEEPPPPAAETGTAAGGTWETAPAAPVRMSPPASGRHSEPATAAMGAEGWPGSSATDSWSSALPARPAPGSTDPWDDERWNRR